jgi:hypothetical protein
MAFDPSFKFNREKYLELVRAQGVSAVITQLQHDIRMLEDEAFEKEPGWQPDLWEEMKKYRDFSAEVWDLRMNERDAQNTSR